MKLTKIILILMILFSSFCICFGQEKPKAELLGEYGKVTWEELVARLDNLLYQLDQKPNSTAYLVINNEKVLDNRDRFTYELYAKGHLNLESRNSFVDKKRIFVIRAEDRDEFKIQIWLVPEGAEKPAFREVKWDVSISPNAKPYIFTKTEWMESGLINYAEYLVLDHFSEYLEGNPTARGHFVIKEKSKETYLKEQAKITNLLVGKYKIAPNRLRFFYVRENKPRWEYPQVEVWLVPRKLN
jgi:hypothetical protein